ncbi:MAG: hypothetical protein ACHQE6_12060, partial [Solirubrobacterales bacterium]
ARHPHQPELVSVAFEIDAETRRRLLGGLDDIAVTLGEEQRIAAYEATREHDGRVAVDTTAL